MLSHPLSSDLLSYLNSPSFSDVIFHPCLSTSPSPSPPPPVDLSTPTLHNRNIHPLRHSQSLTLPPPSFSPSSSPPTFSFSPSPPSSSSLTPLTLDPSPLLYAHRVILAGRSPFFSRLLPLLSSLSPTSPPPLSFPSLSPHPFLTLLPPSSPHLLHLSLLIHPDTLHLLLRFVYTNKFDFSSLPLPPPSSPDDSVDEQPLFDPQAAPFSPDGLSLPPSSPLYPSIIVQQLLFYARLFELPLYSSLTVHLCTAAPRLLQLHLHAIAAVKAEAGLGGGATGGTAPIPIGGEGAKAGRAGGYDAAPFLSPSALRFGSHDAARGVYVRIHSPPPAHSASDAAAGASLFPCERVRYNGCEWVRYKVDPLLFACRSGFFYAMFNADWSENQLTDDSSLASSSSPASPSSPSSSPYKNDVVLEALSQAEFEHLLQFLYTDRISLPSSSSSSSSFSSSPLHSSPTSSATFLQRSLQHLAIDNEWTLRLLSSSPSFTHLLSLMSFSILYHIPSFTEHLQTTLASLLTCDTVCAVWPLVLNPFLSPSSTTATADDGSCDANMLATSLPSTSPLDSPPPSPLFSSSYFSPSLPAPFTELELLHDACLLFTCQHFLQVSHHPSFLSLPLSLLKQTLDGGTVECDSTGMIEALERWIDRAVEGEGVKRGGVKERERKNALRLCLFPPSTLFNISEKRRVMMGDRAFFTRFGWMPPSAMHR